MSRRIPKPAAGIAAPACASPAGRRTASDPSHPATTHRCRRLHEPGSTPLNFAFRAVPLDRCTVRDAQGWPQPGFHGGWMISSLASPFNGMPGSMGW